MPIFEYVETKLMECKSTFSERVNNKFVSIKVRHGGLTELLNIQENIRNKNLTNCKFNLDELSALKFAPIVSADVERAFSVYKELLSDRRKLLSESSLEENMIIQFNKRIVCIGEKE